MTYYGLVSKGRNWAEVKVEKEPNQRLVQTETGMMFTSFAAGNAAIAAKNLDIARQRCGR